MSAPWRIALTIALVLLGIGGGMFALRTARKIEQQLAVADSADQPPPAPAAAPAAPAAPARFPGELLLDGFGDPASRPEQDLLALRELLEAYHRLLGGEDPPPPTDIATLAAGLRGNNRLRQAMLPPDHPAFGPGGRLVDRWGGPLSIRRPVSGPPRLHSAGPDRRPDTPDDLSIPLR